MRKLGLIIAALTALIAASLVTPAAASDPSPGRAPAPSMPHAGPLSSQLTAPAGVLAPTSVVSTPACDGQFHTISSPNRTGNNVLEGTSTVGVNDVWSVGASNLTQTTGLTLAEHWNGSTWSLVPTVSPGTRRNFLFSASAISSSNVWAVGFYDIGALGNNNAATLAEHWNGSSWTKVTTVNPTAASYLYGVTAIDSTHVWAVGEVFDFINNMFHPLVEFYNGTTWSVPSAPVDVQGTGGFNNFFSVSAFNNTDVWAVGNYGPFDGSTSIQPLAEHWNGATWTVEASTGPSGGDNEIIGVNALEAGHAVGVGDSGFTSTGGIEQGAVWDLQTSVPSTSALLSSTVTSHNGYQAVARSGDGVWAVGFTSATPTSAAQTLAWAGSWDDSSHTLTWAAGPATSANPSTVFDELFGVAAISPSVFWAVGEADTPTLAQTLSELFCGLHFNVTAPANAVPNGPFNVTVTAKNADNSTATNYRGTIHFTSSDAQAVLPADYTFTPANAGTKNFSVTLVDVHNNPTTITVIDTVAPFETGSTTVTVACSGACPAPPGTPGGRGSDPTTGGPAIPGGRGTNPAPPATPGPRVPAGSSVGGTAPRLHSSAAPRVKVPARKAIAARPRAVPHTMSAVRSRTAIHSAPSTYAMAPAASTQPLAPADPMPWFLLLLLPALVAALGLFARSRQPID